MGAVTRDRGCCYYIPWLASFCTCTVIAGLGVWIHFTNASKNKTLDALDELGIQVANTDRIKPALIATSITYCCMAVVLFLVSLWRSFVEAGHDATGVATGGSLAFLVLNALFNIGWWFLVVWEVFLIMGCTIWAALVYIMREACTEAAANIDTYGSAVWAPSAGTPCPGQCLNLQSLAFVSSSLQDACICDKEALLGAGALFNKTFEDHTPYVLLGIWLMFVGGLCLLMNVACQFSHTKREREILLRVTGKNQFGTA